MADSNIVVSGLTVAPGIGQLVLDWAAVDTSEFRSLPYMQLDKFEIWQSSTNNRANATKVGETPANQYVAKNLGASVTRYFWVRARDRSLPAGNLGDFYPLSATAGISGTTSSVIPPPNSIDHDMLQDDSVDDNNLRLNAVKAENIDVVNLAAISATLGNVTVNGNLIVNGTLTTLKIGTQQVTRGDTVTNPGQASLSTTTQAFASASIPNIPSGAAVSFVASIVIGWSNPDSGAFGNVDMWIRRGSTVIGSKKRVKVDDSWAGLQTWPCTDNNPPANPTYELAIQAIDSGATLQHFGNQGTIQWLLCQR